jgi:methionyl-tRNA formyltransferase
MGSGTPSGQPLRLAFFGTPEFALPSFHRLCEGPHEMALVISQPDRPRGRGRTRTPSPVAQAAQGAGLPLLRPEAAGAAEVLEAIAAQRIDLGVVVAFGQFLPRKVRESPSLGYLINGHASLLPRHRGAAPIQRAILAGDRVSGVSVMRVEREMDAGPVALQREIPIGDDEDAGSLAARIAALTADALAEAIDLIAAGRVEWTPQDDAAATIAPKLERGEAAIDWQQPAAVVVRRIRAFAPTPGAFTRFGDEPLRILAARAHPAGELPASGTVRRPSSTELHIAAADGWIEVVRLQRAGGKSLATADFLRGRDIPDGTKLD